MLELGFFYLVKIINVFERGLLRCDTSHNCCKSAFTKVSIHNKDIIS